MCPQLYLPLSRVSPDPFKWSVQPGLLAPYILVVIRAALTSEWVPQAIKEAVASLRRRFHPRILMLWDRALGPYFGMISHLNRLRCGYLWIICMASCLFCKEISSISLDEHISTCELTLMSYPNHQSPTALTRHLILIVLGFFTDGVSTTPVSIIAKNARRLTL